MNWPGRRVFGSAVTVALVMFRFFTTPLAPITPNMPTLVVPTSSDAMVRSLMVCPSPSNRR